MARRALLGPFPLSTRHAHFQVCVHIHELVHVPLLSGEFSLDWHVKHSVAHARKTLAGLASVDENHDDGTEHPTTLDQEEEAVRDHSGNEWTPAEAAEQSRSPRSTTPDPSPVANLADSPEHVRPSASMRDDASLYSPRPIDTNVGPDDASIASAPVPMRRSRPRARSNTSSGAGGSIFALVQHHTASGHTPYLGVQGHSVQWDTRIESVVRVAVGRPDTEVETKDSDSIRSTRSETSAGRLRPSRIRLRVYHRQPDEGDTRHKFGSLTLDLAEYAPRLSSMPGSHVRRESRQFLLDQCSCNALLRLSIEMTYLDGTNSYAVPSIQQGMLDPTSLQSGERGLRSPPGPDLPSSITASGPEPAHGLAWHSKLPLPLLYQGTAVKPEFLRQEEAHAASSFRRNSLVHSFSHDATQPRHTYCRMNSASLIDDLFSGLLGPLEDQRSEEPAAPHTAPLRRRMRWRQLLPGVPPSAKSSSHHEDIARPTTRVARRRSGEHLRKHGLPPLHFRFRPEDTAEAPATS
ncbi:hypothetical protein MNAN1_001678 [Malassezia nana]|uniref:C2 NT-type domain-containing protein n=1 Tax=Malassezia nana TaxID=180528 RepID=A0AAF0J3E0_9BASI|nr:hypothetical protein MNAN1_001678 [Malassezia nana]